MAWMVATKKFPYGGAVHEIGERFFMPDSDDIYRRLFIEEGKAKEDEVLNRPPREDKWVGSARPGHPFVGSEGGYIESAAARVMSGKGLPEPRSLKAAEDEDDDGDEEAQGQADDD